MKPLMPQPADVPPVPAPHVDPLTFASREGTRTRADRLSGLIIGLIMLAALGLAGRRIWTIATGPLPPSAGVAAPLFVANTPAGASIGLESRRGDVVLVDFWATWCPPCVASMPGLQRMHTQYGGDGFTVLGVNQEPGQDVGVAAFMRRRQLTFDTVMDPGHIARSWGVYSFPTSFLIGRDGQIRHVYRGPASEGRLKRDIESALKDTAPSS